MMKNYFYLLALFGANFLAFSQNQSTDRSFDEGNIVAFQSNDEFVSAPANQVNQVSKKNTVFNGNSSKIKKDLGTKESTTSLPNKTTKRAFANNNSMLRRAGALSVTYSVVHEHVVRRTMVLLLCMD